MYKYCYVDINSSTNVQQMFENYREEIAALRVKHPSLKIVHITVPLTAVEPAARAWVKTLLGRATERDADAKRNEFNRRLRQTYAGRDPIFDLAEGESTSPDGSRSYFIRDKERVFTLASEYTTDGGHLNEAGRLAMAERLLLLLAIISPPTYAAGRRDGRHTQCWKTRLKLTVRVGAGSGRAAEETVY